ncbi:MAG: 23S rRNA pseudouridine(1911/1915/1917) synthase RluD [Cardiobacteriaceae bacterium]|nr:23S rRNA pseudouridine(1911/1915/1917) synthase RluD [Cardiobacteriaceae bacterium]
MTETHDNPTLQHQVDQTLQGKRLDQALAELSPEYSRSRWQQAIKAGSVLVNQRVEKAKYILMYGDEIIAELPEAEPSEDLAENIAIEVVHQDKEIIVIHKPAGLVVHPAAGNASGTLLNALLYHFPELSKLPRAGIVHRLDKDTSGLMVVARSLRAHHHLVEQLQSHDMGRTYLALVYRYVTAGNTIDKPIGRHPHDRLKMAVREDGREAITHFRIEERFGEVATLLRVQLETGRTHQIRVHLSDAHYPLVGDPLYGKAHIIKGTPAPIREALQQFPRQALHATELALYHPKTEQELVFECPVPEDMTKLLETLRPLQSPQ